jgi:hypothetical protein
MRTCSCAAGSSRSSTTCNVFGRSSGAPGAGA